MRNAPRLRYDIDQTQNQLRSQRRTVLQLPSKHRIFDTYSGLVVIGAVNIPCSAKDRWSRFLPSKRQGASILNLVWHTLHCILPTPAISYLHTSISLLHLHAEQYLLAAPVTRHFAATESTKYPSIVSFISCEPQHYFVALRISTISSLAISFNEGRFVVIIERERAGRRGNTSEDDEESNLWNWAMDHRCRFVVYFRYTV